MTPNELNMSIEVYSENLKISSEEKLHLEWVNAYWQRIDVLKSFSEMIGKNDEQKEKVMSDLEMLTNAHKLNELFGGSVE